MTLRSVALVALRLLKRPQLCVPDLVLRTFLDLPVPPETGVYPAHKIRAIVLDKDNCFAVDQENDIHEPYKAHFSRLQQYYGKENLLIVSNSAGSSRDINYANAAEVETATHVDVLRHEEMKPNCGLDILNHFRAKDSLRDCLPSNIALVGDRLLTDTVQANVMGFHSVWLRDGISPNTSIIARCERLLLRACGGPRREATKAYKEKA